MAEAAAKPDLKTLIAPIFLGVANYWQLSKLGEEVPLDKFRSDMEVQMERARDASHGDPDLARAFDRVHDPLIFFIDYMVKEGPFAFKDEWRLMARDFNELSGDEKFFEVLEEVLRYSDNPETLLPFYTMLGLGFDGIYHRDPAKIHAYLKLLADKLGPTFDHRSEYLTRLPVKKRVAARRQTFFGKYRILCVTGALAAAAFLVNVTFFFIATAEFRGAVTSAAANAMVFSTGSSTPNANLPPIPYERPAVPSATPVSAAPAAPEPVSAEEPASTEEPVSTEAPEAAAGEPAVDTPPPPIPSASTAAEIPEEPSNE